jgi:hypothetical protein
MKTRIIQLVILILVINLVYADVEVPDNWDNLGDHERVTYIESEPLIFNSLTQEQQYEFATNNPDSFSSNLNQEQQKDFLTRDDIGNDPNAVTLIQNYIWDHGANNVFNDPQLKDTFDDYCQNDNNFNSMSNEDQFIFAQSRTPGNVDFNMGYDGEHLSSFTITDEGRYLFSVGTQVIDLTSLDANTGITSITVGSVPIVSDYLEGGFAPGVGFILNDSNGNSIRMSHDDNNIIKLLPLPAGSDASLILDKGDGNTAEITAGENTRVSLNGDSMSVSSTDGVASYQVGNVQVDLGNNNVYTSVEINGELHSLIDGIVELIPGSNIKIDGVNYLVSDFVGSLEIGQSEYTGDGLPHESLQFLINEGYLIIPTEPEPVEPTPTEPTPNEPETTPEPDETEAVEPIPTEPEAVEPTPTEPTPNEPETTPEPDETEAEDEPEPDETSTEEPESIPEDCYYDEEGELICFNPVIEVEFPESSSNYDFNTGAITGEGNGQALITDNYGTQYSLNNQDGIYIVENNGEKISATDTTLNIRAENDDNEIVIKGDIQMSRETNEEGDEIIKIILSPPTYRNGTVKPGTTARYQLNAPNLDNEVIQIIESNTNNFMPGNKLVNGVLSASNPNSTIIKIKEVDGITRTESIQANVTGEGYCKYCFLASLHCVKGKKFFINFDTDDLSELFPKNIHSPIMRETVKEVILQSPDAYYINMITDYKVTSSKYGSEFNPFEEKTICFKNCSLDSDNKIQVYLQQDIDDIVSTGVMGNMIIDYGNNIREVYDPNFVMLNKYDLDYSSFFKNIDMNTINKEKEKDLLFRLNREADPENPSNEMLRVHQELYYQNAVPASFSDMNEKVRFQADNNEGYIKLNFFTYLVDDRRKLVLNRYSYNNVVEFNFLENRNVEIPINTFVIVDDLIKYNVERDLSISPNVYDIPIYFRSPDEVKEAFGEMI